MLRFALFALTLGVGCGGAPAKGDAKNAERPMAVALHGAPGSPLDRPLDVLVVAPHPDDETLMAGGVLHAAVRRGERVGVVVVTNGDFTCARDGFARQRETVSAMALAGVPEDAIAFLGYPDGYLAALGDEPLPPVERRDEQGRCIRANTTYAAEGAGDTDEHARRTGEHALYTDEALEEDLAAIVSRTRPREVYVPHGIDDHPDHAMTYAFVRRAFERARFVPRTVHRAVVHAGPCWPNGRSAREPCPPVTVETSETMPALPAPFDRYVARERIAVPQGGAFKLAMIARYPSQTGPKPETDWLAAFARADEAFYPEVLERDDDEPDQYERAPSRAASRSLAPQPTFALVQAAPPRPERPSRCSGYDLVTNDDRSALTLYARRGDGAPRALRSWALPAGAERHTRHTYALFVDPRADDSGVVELSVRRDGEYFGLAVDPTPPRDCGTGRDVLETDGQRRTPLVAAGP